MRIEMFSISRIRLFVIIVLLVFTLCGCWGQKEYHISGHTMGTVYHIKIVAGRFENMVALQAKIEARLEQINQSMSTYQPDSEISRFNTLPATNIRFPISQDFLAVMTTARRVHQLTQGTWDGTINPLVNLWGFGKDGVVDQPPSTDAVAKALTQVDFKAIVVDESGFLMKKKADLTLDLASIAKGYGVDQITRLLQQMNYINFLVEIGGEVYAAGRRIDGHSWRVGINQPHKGADSNAVYKVVDLENMAMATSGDYRNFFQIDERTYSHIIDPRTGYPVQNSIVSVSVMAPDCILADGLATALMVMGPQNGVALLNRLDGIEGLIVVQKPDGRLENHWSAGLIE